MSSWRNRNAFCASAAALGAMLLATVATTSPARAQFFGFWNWPASRQPAAMPAPVLYRLLIRRGFRPVAPVERNGGVYLADVRDRFGRRERLVIDVYSGAILQSFAYALPRPPGDIPGVRPYSYAPPSPGPSIAPPVSVSPEPALSPERREAERKKRAARRLARREAEPKTPDVGGASPSQAAREPVLTAPSGAANATDRRGPKAVERDAKEPKSVAAPKQEAEAAKPVSVAAPARVAPKPHPANVTGPGYANGVPINPLD